MASGGKLIIKLYDSVVCRLKLGGKSKYIEIPAEYVSYTPTGTVHSSISSNEGFVRLSFESVGTVEMYIAFSPS